MTRDGEAETGPVRENHLELGPELVRPCPSHVGHPGRALEEMISEQI